MSVLPGPTKKSVADFWRMVWEKQVLVVVMITKCVELGKHKCVQYWPDNGSTTYGNVVVRVAKTQKCEGYDLRTIRLHSEVCTANNWCTVFLRLDSAATIFTLFVLVWVLLKGGYFLRVAFSLLES